MNRDGDNLADLVAQARAGELEAFEQLYRSHQGGIYAFIKHQVGEAELAADLTQQTFVRAWQSLPRLRKLGAFRAWLHRIAANLVRDEMKSGRARLEVLATSLGESDPIAHSPGLVGDWPEEAVLSEELRGAVRLALASLVPEQRAVVVMHHLEGMPVAEIAEALRVRPGTVMSRLARARAAMRECLGPYVEGNDE